MRGLAAVRELRLVPEFRVLKLEQVRDEWDAFVAGHPAATLYHRGEWLEVLRRAFGVSPSLAMLRDHNQIVAGCLLASSGNPFRRGLVSMPFSDFCPPVAADGAVEDSLLELMGVGLKVPLEVRGSDAPAPWQVLDHFQHWTLDLSRPFATIEKAADREIRRHVRRAREAGVTIERRADSLGINSFFRLHLERRRRLGVPSQPKRFFKAVHGVFAAKDSLEVWLASYRGRHIAAVVVLRDGDVLHAKWSTRVASGPTGASHFIFVSIAEHWAGRSRLVDLGRTDIHSRGLTRFKRELGAQPAPLPYSYWPQAPQVTSAEHLTGAWAAASRVWRHLPLPVVQALSNMTYRYLA